MGGTANVQVPGLSVDSQIHRNRGEKNFSWNSKQEEVLCLGGAARTLFLITTYFQY